MNSKSMYSLVVVSPVEENPSWFPELRAHLLNTANHIHEISRQKDLETAVDSDAPDAVIIADHNPRKFLKSLRRKALYERPVLVLVTDDAHASQNGQASLYDLILPPVPSWIDQQLQSLLSLREENMALRRDNQKLTEELSRFNTTDETQRQWASDEINLIKNAIVRNVSHELKTPLLQVKSAVALLAEANNEGDSKLIGYAKDATARLETVIKNITQLADSLDPAPGPVIVRECIDYAVLNLKRIWERKDATRRIQVKFDEQLPPAWGDKQGLSTVMQLLIDNALKFSDDEVQVAAIFDKGSVLVSVRDRGIGIAKDKLDLIFEPFYQVDSSSTRTYGGTGVGLAIVRLILSRHQVKISVNSQVGKGSEFFFRLPMADPKSIPD
jgi:signal transduction histidine kinase